MLDGVAETITPGELTALDQTLQQGQPRPRVVVNLPTGNNRYVVQAADAQDPAKTLDMIAARYSLTTAALRALNGLAPEDTVAVGDVLRVRQDGTIQPAQLAYLTPAVPDTLILKELTV
jgi:LysM repeat protein